MKRKFFVILAVAAGVACGTPGFSYAADKDMKSDNSRVNKTEGTGKAVTADQQKENKPDRKIAQQIRRAVVKDKSLSTYAHNVKIIVQGGNVTLKGPVRSEAEKSRIEQIANEALAGQGQVANQLTVVPKEKKSKDKEKKSE